MKKTLKLSGNKNGKKFLLLIVMVLQSIITCKKDTDDENINMGNTSNFPDAISPEDLKYLDNIKEVDFSINSMILPNGETVYNYLSANDPSFLTKLNNNLKITSNLKADSPKDYKMILIARMLATAGKFAYRNNFDIKAIPGDPNSPAQHGLAYSYGQKDYTVRSRPPTGIYLDKDKKNYYLCSQKIYGLDCSGLVYQVAKFSNLTLSNNPPADCNAKFESEIFTWVKAFSNSEEFKNLRIEDLGGEENGMNSSKIESGDIIYWSDIDGVPKHIGIATYTFRGLGAFMSTGSPGNCDSNLDNKHGPVQKELGPNLLKNWFTACGGKCHWGVLRVTADMHYFPYNACNASFSSRASFNNSKRGNYDLVIGSGAHMTGTFEFTNYTFKGTKCAAYACDPKTKLGLEVTIDLEDHSITGFHWSSADSVLKADGTYFYTKKTVTGSELLLPIRGRYPNASFSVWGTDASLYIKELTCLSTYIEKDYDHPNGQLITDILTKVKYDNDTRLEFSFYKKL